MSIANAVVGLAGTKSAIQVAVIPGHVAAGVGPVTVQAGAAITLSTTTPDGSALSGLLTTPSLTMAGSAGAWTGTLDVGHNALDVPGASLATVTSQVGQGYAGGGWTGAGGIVSAAAAADASRLTAVGVIENDEGGSPLYTAANPFDGTSPAATDVLVTYTYYGDANLDGKVDGQDYALIDAGSQPVDGHAADRLVQRRLQLRRQGRRERLHADRQRVQPTGGEPVAVVARGRQHGGAGDRRHRGRSRAGVARRSGDRRGRAARPPASPGLIVTTSGADHDPRPPWSGVLRRPGGSPGVGHVRSRPARRRDDSAGIDGGPPAAVPPGGTASGFSPTNGFSPAVGIGRQFAATAGIWRLLCGPFGMAGDDTRPGWCGSSAAAGTGTGTGRNAASGAETAYENLTNLR